MLSGWFKFATRQARATLMTPLLAWRPAAAVTIARLEPQGRIQAQEIKSR